MCDKARLSKKDAQTKANALKGNTKKGFMRIYHCEECNAWHITKHKINKDFGAPITEVKRKRNFKRFIDK
jgi:hypothetical protein